MRRMTLIALTFLFVNSLRAQTPPDLAVDLTTWPNKRSFKNSDAWLVKNHKKLRRMKPRVLVLNFANSVDMESIKKKTEKFIASMAEASRYHGFESKDSPAFLQYEVVRYVDLRDEAARLGQPSKSSSKIMPRQPKDNRDAEIDYSGLFSKDFAKHLGIPNPKRKGQFLDLKTLVNKGFVHELWFYAYHRPDVWPGRETIEDKQHYDAKLNPIRGAHGPAGNGHSKTMPWIGRSFRIAFFNPHRGVGCMMENMGHQFEAIANTDAIKWFTPYFREYAELDLDVRYGLPFKSLYEVPYGERAITYKAKDTLVVTYKGKEYRIEGYEHRGGNVHFPPGAREHYDLRSPFVVRSTIKNWRRRNGEQRRDQAVAFSKEEWQSNNGRASDCMGPWVIYWMQCMPGLGKKSIDDNKNPMLNWWPFLYF